MKRVFLALCVASVLLLCGCTQLVPSQYTQVSPHAEEEAAPDTADFDVLSADSKGSLKRAIRSLVQNGVEHGVIHVREYDGDVEADLADAAYQIAREDPLGLYAVDYMTHDCSLIVSFYEIHIDITFRDFATPLDEIPYVSGDNEAAQLLRKAMDNYEDHLTLYLTYNSKLDYEAEAERYFEENPRRLMARPALHAASYPEGKSPRIVELAFTYPATGEALREMEQAVNDTLAAAKVYVRYRDSDLEKAKLLYSYLTERFSYEEGASDTPIYSLLCEGVADSQSMTTVWQLLCDETGLECYSVDGLRAGAPYRWNIVLLDGEYVHLDLLRDVMETGELQPRYDEDMTEYYYDASAYPACPAPLPADAPADTPDEPALETEPGESGKAPEAPEENSTQEPSENGETSEN